MNEVPGHKGWFFTTIDPHPNGGLETEVYKVVEKHSYPGILVRGVDKRHLLHNIGRAIDRQPRLLSAKL